MAVGATLGLAATASVLGGAVMTLAYAVSAISGGVGATQTFTITVTIHAITGSATNHVAVVGYQLVSNGSGITVA